MLDDEPLGTDTRLLLDDVLCSLGALVGSFLCRQGIPVVQILGSTRRMELSLLVADPPAFQSSL